MKQNQVQQKEIRLGTHGEHYGSWMSNPVFYVIGALLALSVVLAVPAGNRLFYRQMRRRHPRHAV